MTTATIKSLILDSTQNKGSVTINEMVLMNQLGHVKIPDYQRGEVWNNNQKHNFICAILDNEPAIPHITIHRDDGHLDIVDGQQRLKAIFGFVNDEFALSKARLQENGLDESLKGKFSKLPDDVQQKVRNFALDFKVTTEPRKSFLRLQNAKPLNVAERNHALLCDLNQCASDLADDYQDLISRCGFDNKRFKASEVFTGCLYMAVHGKAASTPKLIQTFYRGFVSAQNEAALQETRDVLTLMDETIREKHSFLGAANFRALFLLILKSDSQSRNMHRLYLNEFLKTCATNERLKAARNRLGDEHMQKDALDEALKKFIAIESAKPIDEMTPDEDAA